MVGDRLYAFGGRQSNHALGNNFGPSLPFGDVYDFTRGQWLTTDASMRIPTGRSGSMAMAWGQELIIAGGESDRQVPAHAEVQAYDTQTAAGGPGPICSRGGTARPW